MIIYFFFDLRPGSPSSFWKHFFHSSLPFGPLAVVYPLSSRLGLSDLLDASLFDTSLLFPDSYFLEERCWRSRSRPPFSSFALSLGLDISTMTLLSPTWAWL